MKRCLYALFVMVMIFSLFLFHGPAVRAEEPMETASVEESAPLEEAAEETLEEPAALKEAAQETLSAQVAQMAICRSVENREPVGAAENFEASVGRLYCFTNIVGAPTPIEITHAWYYGDTERALVSLSVRSPNWRTYSSKNIMAQEVGQWRVDVIGPEGEVLKTQTFTITQ